MEVAFGGDCQTKLNHKEFRKKQVKRIGPKTSSDAKMGCVESKILSWKTSCYNVQYETMC